MRFTLVSNSVISKVVERVRCQQTGNGYMSHYDYDYDGHLCVALFDVWSISSEADTHRGSIISIGPESDNCLLVTINTTFHGPDPIF